MTKTKEIKTYDILAISVAEFIDSLEKNILVPLKKPTSPWGENSDLNIALDDKFTKLCESNMPSSFLGTEYRSSKEIAHSGFLDKGFLWKEDGSFIGLAYPGPASVFTGVILSTAGIKDSVFFEEQCQMIWRFNERAKLKILPMHLVKYLVHDHEYGFGIAQIQDESILASIVSSLEKQKLLTTFKSCIYDKENKKVEVSVEVSCLKTSLSNLLEEWEKYIGIDDDVARKKISACENWMQDLINDFINFKHPYGFGIGIISSSVQNNDIPPHVHYWSPGPDNGGMKEDVPYILASDKEPENHWADPSAQENDNSIQRLKEILFGKNTSLKFERFTPQCLE